VGARQEEGCAGLRSPPVPRHARTLDLGEKYSESHDRATTRSRCNRMEMENAQAVTECAGKEALSGPREAFTRHSGVNPSPGSPPGLC
jgi:hypothetical protein